MKIGTLLTISANVVKYFAYHRGNFLICGPIRDNTWKKFRNEVV